MEAVSTTAPDLAVREFLDRYVAALRSGEVERIVDHYAPDIVAFDAIAALRFVGREAYRRHWEWCLSFMQGGMLFEIHELAVHAAGDAAYVHYLCRCGGTDDKGEQHLGWMRATAGLRRDGQVWKLVHEHFSVPFGPESGTALTELEP